MLYYRFSLYTAVCLSEHVFVLVGSSLRDWESQESLILAIRDFSTHTSTHKHTHFRAHSYQPAQWTIMMCCAWVCLCVRACALMRGYQSSHDRGNPVQWQVWISQLVCVCVCVYPIAAGHGAQIYCLPATLSVSQFVCCTVCVPLSTLSSICTIKLAKT